MMGILLEKRNQNCPFQQLILTIVMRFAQADKRENHFTHLQI